MVPKIFARIRHYGFLANRNKKKNIAVCRGLMGLKPDLPVVPKKSAQAIMLTLTGIDMTRCPCCKIGKMKKIHEIPEGAGPTSFMVIRPMCLRNKDAL